MLDTSTKRRIDTARDILVGKVPDPKSQVEQITIALIYKFMDDMDAESEEFGGKRKFFAGEFARYGWAKLMRSGLGGHETLNLYAEAIAKMPENPGIPLLFRDIFKNAYLPYRDPETLRAFLKIIDEFEYDHSERLGDAFEYLLSVLGSQGDAGQFRTPRHIIDFIVTIIDPQKHETVLDPACGTAGFLISTYKHILRANSSPEGAEPNGSKNGDEATLHTSKIPPAKGDLLTPDEKGRLAQNFKGYDISPDMVRLSLVNLYLHGFNDPHIVEYDTLTSQDRWNEYADVILANPPFMSPKGGIKPHNRFSVQSKRSEVLFVDYMAEHLTPTGRAGIIVPEGIIFQSQTAYKQLRKMLVEESLVAIVSLPAGVFNPYSGVKTSILILDKSLAKQSETIGFFRIENDGFGLGAQRRPIDKNDLPQAHAEIAEYLRRLRIRESVEPSPSGRGQGEGFEPTLGLIAPKEKIAANGDYNLSGERYREGAVATSSYPFVPISEVARVKNGFAFKSEEYEDKGLRVMRIKNVQKGEVIDDDPKFMATERRKEFADYTLKAGDILMSLTGNVGRVGRLKHEHEPAVLNQRVAHVEPMTGAPCLPEYLFALLNTEKFEADAIAGSSGVAQANLSSKWVGDYQIPLPPLEVQKEIVAEIEGYQKVVDGARAVLDHYRPHIPIHPDWPMVELAEIAEIVMGTSPPGDTYNIKGEGVPLINGPVEFGPEPFSRTVINQYTTQPIRTCRKDDLILCVRGATLGRMNIAGYDGAIGRGVAAIRSEKSQRWVEFCINAMRDRILSLGAGSTFPSITTEQLRTLPIPLPPLETQRAIVAEIKAEQALVHANRELITRFEKKIQATLARIWGEDERALPEA